VNTAFPGIEELSPATKELLERTAEETGIEIRRRCCMPEMAMASQCGWRHRPVTASIRGSLPGLSATQVSDIYKEALRVWNSVCNTGLQWTDNFNTANIWANCQKIDGASGTLAWSYLIQCGGSTINTQVEQRYDNSERWTHDWFLEVCLHEIGHALGLNHINNPKALMNPYSSGGRILVPTSYELEIMVPLYGKPVATPPTPEPGGLAVSGGVLLIDGGKSAGVTPNGQLTYSGRTYKVGVTPV
jgi:hypothetical protein